jgi:hypothetical protein
VIQLSNATKDAKTLEEENKRRKQVYKEKLFGMKIERIEKLRLVSDISSIKSRIVFYTHVIHESIGLLREKFNSNDKSISLIVNEYSKIFRTYESIREDICLTIEKKEGNFRKEFDALFPKISFLHETYSDIHSSLLDVSGQLLDVDSYLNRYLG